MLFVQLRVQYVNCFIVLLIFIFALSHFITFNHTNLIFFIVFFVLSRKLSRLQSRHLNLNRSWFWLQCITHALRRNNNRNRHRCFIALLNFYCRRQRSVHYIEISSSAQRTMQISKKITKVNINQKKIRYVNKCIDFYFRERFWRF